MHEHDGISENPVDHAASARHGTRARFLAASAVGVAYGWWAVSLPPFSAGAAGAVLAAGVMGVVAGTPIRRPAQAARPVPGWGRWAVLAVMAMLWQLAAYVQHPREDHPTLSSLANALLGSQPARAVAFALWLLTAVHLARR